MYDSGLWNIRGWVFPLQIVCRPLPKQSCSPGFCWSSSSLKRILGFRMSACVWQFLGNAQIKNTSLQIDDLQVCFPALRVCFPALQVCFLICFNHQCWSTILMICLRQKVVTLVSIWFFQFVSFIFFGNCRYSCDVTGLLVVNWA